MTTAEPGDLARELKWQVKHIQRLERQLDQVLARAYAAERTNGRLWAALSLLAAGRGATAEVVPAGTPAPGWSEVGRSLADAIVELAAERALPELHAPPQSKVRHPSAVPAHFAHLVTHRAEIEEVTAPPAPQADGIVLLEGAVSLIPSSGSGHHAVNVPNFPPVEEGGAIRGTLRFLARASRLDFLRVTLRARAKASTAHLVLDMTGGTAVASIRSDHAVLELTSAEPSGDGWLRFDLDATLSRDGETQLQFTPTLSEHPKDTHFAGQPNQHFDLAWVTFQAASK